jgi:RNA-directed DNA polymerase
MTTVNEDASARVRSVLELTHQEARLFFLKQESYCNFDLPPYFQFSELLSGISNFLDTQDNFNNLCVRKNAVRDFDDVNHTILQNKDGRYGWRSMQLVNPVLYVRLVHLITEEQAWAVIVDRFQKFSENKKIICLSLPVESTEGKDKAAQILHWWQEVEQRSIELALEYEHITHTDITDCYGSIYTHSIPWAIHEKHFIKTEDNRHNQKLVGNAIDICLQDMHHGQTNGIPVGSVLMDFIAEIVLSYVDLEVSEQIKVKNIEDYKILRYRDDYRIFITNPVQGELILKIIAEVLSGLGLKLSSSKTRVSNMVIRDSVKSDKMAWLKAKQGNNGLQKHLMLIHDFSESHPNSGSLIRALSDFQKRLIRKKVIRTDALPMISIAVDIGMRNPKTYPLIAAILSKLLACLDSADLRAQVFEKIRKRFYSVPNTGHLDIWLQRASVTFDKSLKFNEPLCQLVAGNQIKPWNNDWIQSVKLKNLIQSKEIINTKTLNALNEIIQSSEVQLFDY